MTDENDQTQEQAPAPEQSAAPDPAQPTKSFTVNQPQQKTLNVVGGVVIATLVAIVLAQAMGDNNELSASEVRLPGPPPNGQPQGPGGMGQDMQGPRLHGQDMQGPRLHGPGMGQEGEDGQRRDEHRDGTKDSPDDKSEKDTDEDSDNDDDNG